MNAHLSPAKQTRQQIVVKFSNPKAN